MKMISSVFDLSEKTAVITGGGTGIGKAIALEFAKAGVDVAIASRSMEHLEPVAKEIKSLGRKALAIPTDLRKEETVEDMVAKTMEEFGHIDILVNNSGTAFLAPFENITLKGWSIIIDIDLTGTYLCCRHVGKHMIEQRSGNIINVSSVMGTVPCAGEVHYGASKAAVISLTSSLAAEWAKYNIRVNCIAPGPILTKAPIEMYATQGITDREFIIKDFGRGTAMKRCGMPEEVAYPAVFLASDAASYISGTTLLVDGCTISAPLPEPTSK
jgi:NAD(P)-dependent dehydrogenase (short-subunit alcohol dehydrogenase family)